MGTNKFKEYRIKAGISQKYVSVVLGIAPPSVSNWESGKTSPSRENIVKLADLYHVSVAQLIGAEDAPEEEQKEKPSGNTAEEPKKLDDELVRRLMLLSPDQVQRVLDFVAGMQAK